MDAEAQLANMREQMALMIGKQLADEELSLKSVWAVHSPTKQATWCPSPDCPTLGRKSTYDIILNDAKENDDGELEHLIMEGVDKKTLDELGDKVETSIRRVGAPTVNLHNLGIIATFTSKAKAQTFMREYMKMIQNTGFVELILTEIELIA